MQFIQTFQPDQFLDTIVSYLAAFVFGTMIGAERQYRQRTAGLRTNVLVAVGAAGFVDLAQGMAGDAEAVRVVSYVVSGVGFLGAGVIMKEGLNVRGLNTAATLWCSAAVGAAAGVDRLAEAALLTAVVISGNTLLRPLVNAINRIPLESDGVEATFTVSITVRADQVGDMRDMLRDTLEDAKYPVAEIEVLGRRANEAEIVATLTSTEVVAVDLDAIVVDLRTRQDIIHATWSANTQS